MTLMNLRILILLLLACAAAEVPVLAQNVAPKGKPERSVGRSIRTASGTREADAGRRVVLPEPVPSTFQDVNRLTSYVPATESQVRALVASIRTAVAERNFDSLKDCFSDSLYVARHLAGVQLTPKMYSEFTRGFRSSSPFSLLCRMSTDGVSEIHVLTVVRRGDEWRPVVRLAGPSGLFYHEFVVARDNETAARVCDFYSYNSADYLSHAVRLMSLGGFVSRKNPERISPQGIEPEIVESADELLGLMEDLLRSRPGDVLRHLDRTSPELQSQTRCLSLKCEFSKPLGADIHRDAVMEFDRLYHGTVAANLALLNLSEMVRDSTQSRLIAEQLLTQISDPFLHHYRIEGLIQDGRTDDAHAAIAAARTAIPNHLSTERAEIGLLMAEDRFQEAAAAIERFESLFPQTPADLTSFSHFERFSDSVPGRRFLARRAGFDF